MDYLARAKEIFDKDIYATHTTGIEIIEADQKYAKCKLDVTSKHRNAQNVVMGGAIFTLADLTFAVAVNTDNELTVSLSANINYFVPAAGDVLYAVARCIKDGRKVCLYDIDIYDENDTLIARVNMQGFKKIIR